MRFDKIKDPTLCATSVTKYSGRRYTGTIGVACIPLDDGRHYLAATDGSALSLIRATIDEGEPIPPADRSFPTDALKAARKVGGAVKLNGSAEVLSAGQRQEWAPVDGMFPMAADVVRDALKAKRPTTVSLDASLLAKLQKAFGSDAVTLEIPEDAGPIVVRPELQNRGDADGSFGLLMPVAAG